MLQFLTRIPILSKKIPNDQKFGKSLMFAPLVGLVIGVMMLLMYNVSILFLNDNISVVITLLFYVFITGGIHLDGLADTFDGLFCGRSKERCLEIMRDSRVGTFGVLALVMIFYLNIELLQSITFLHKSRALLFMPVTGRMGSVLSATIGKYARSSDGLGRSFIQHCGAPQGIIGVLISTILAFFLFGVTSFIYIGICALTTVIIVCFSTKKIGGITGDVCGATCEIVQLVFLLLVNLIATGR